MVLMNTPTVVASPLHLSYQTSLASWVRSRGKEPEIRAALEVHQEALLLLWHLDLGPLQDDLRACYAPSPRGGDPWMPTCMLRTLLLAAFIGAPELHGWVSRLTESPVLRALSGFLDGDRPGIGTFYDFFHRLHDGWVLPGTRKLAPSVIERARTIEAREVPRAARDEAAEAPVARPVAGPEVAKHKLTAAERRMAAEKRKAEKKEEKARRAAERRKERAKHDPKWSTENAVKSIEARGSPGVDLDRRLGELLWKAGVLPSIAVGMLPKELVVAGDGSSLATAASGLGIRVCDHPPREHCACKRRFADPDAARGFDSYRKCFYFGYKFYEMIFPDAALPLMTGLHGANVPDGYSAPLALDALLRLNEAHGNLLKITHFIGDTGHDNERLARWLLEQSIQPVIAISSNVPRIHPERPDLPLSERAVPLCEGGVEMASWGTAGPLKPVFVCPVKAGKLATCPKAPADNPAWVCRPGTELAPTVALNSEDNPRLFPPISRNSKAFAKHYAKRSACERSNNTKKGPHALEACRHRRISFWKIRVTLIALLQHAKAWVAGLSARDLLEGLLSGTTFSSA
jgi:hypothetical protein